MIVIEISRPLVTKLRDLKMINMAFQVVFSAKNVPRFSFGILVAPKLKNKVRAIMALTWFFSFGATKSPKLNLGTFLAQKNYLKSHFEHF